MAILVALTDMGRVVLTVVGTVPLAALKTTRALRNTQQLLLLEYGPNVIPWVTSALTN